jgi:predicted component of type VI protein secretion system
VLVHPAGSRRSRISAASTAPSSTAGGSTRDRLESGDEVQIGKYRLSFHQQMSAPAKSSSSSERLLTIGTVTPRLQEEFPEISISKIRYLEDQGLLAPRRTQGGYRLFSEEDVERLSS